MFRRRTYLFLFSLFTAILSALLAAAQEKAVDIDALKKTAPKVFIDCGRCDLDYIRTEITFVNYVRDPKEAQIYILVTTLRTGSGGREYTISFIGQQEFQGVDDTQKYFSHQTDTEDETRQGLVQALKVSLMSYVARTAIASRIVISYAGEEKPAAADKWNYWIFSLSAGGFLSGEEFQQSRSLQVSFSANRLTPGLKIRMSASARHSLSNYEYDSQTITSTTEEYEINGLLVKSLNEHWSVGGYLKASSSTYENILFSLSPSPAVEYNFFPYSQSTRRQLRCLYTLKFTSLRYREETIYDKESENLWGQSLSVTLDIKEKWGSISTTLAGSHYFHDFSKNRQTLFSVLNLQLLKGLSVFAFAGGSRIHDQLYLAKGEASLEEVLLQRRQLATSYNYFFSVGLSYTFGSIFTNVVNPRFGDSGQAGVSINID
jgi:hypothetical protein